VQDAAGVRDCGAAFALVWMRPRIRLDHIVALAHVRTGIVGCASLWPVCRADQMERRI
jgi:hypothetical protein